MNYETDELSPEERQVFSGLSKEKMPPLFLEERILGELRQANVIRSPKPRLLPSYPRIGIAFALSIAIFVIGATVGARRASVRPAKSDRPPFMLFVRMSRPELEAKTAEEERQRVSEYSEWARDLASKGLLLGGEKLRDEDRFLSHAKNGPAIVETRSNAAEGAVAGYFLLSANDYDQAVTIAKTCPCLKYGEAVEVRQIDRF